MIPLNTIPPGITLTIKSNIAASISPAVEVALSTLHKNRMSFLHNPLPANSAEKFCLLVEIKDSVDAYSIGAVASAASTYNSARPFSISCSVIFCSTSSALTSVKISAINILASICVLSIFCKYIIIRYKSAYSLLPFSASRLFCFWNSMTQNCSNSRGLQKKCRELHKL